jgi:hypothetical protein
MDSKPRGVTLRLPGASIRMSPMTPLKALVVKLLPALTAVAILGTVGGYSVHEYMSGGCCHAGMACCHPGSPCCAGHRVAMK